MMLILFIVVRVANATNIVNVAHSVDDVNVGRCC